MKKRLALLPCRKSNPNKMSCKKTVSVCIIVVMNVFTILAQGITEIIGPPGSGAFATSITTLPNGNFVVTDPLFDSDGIKDVGAVHLYDGNTRTLISSLTGSKANDNVGDNPVVVLPNGNYVVISEHWDGSSKPDVGAATWCSALTGVSGKISELNSLLGSNTNDFFNCSIITLSNGNYFLHNPYFDNGPALDAGAVTWVDAASGIAGFISQSNSLMGSSTNDRIGTNNSGTKIFVPLKNGNCAMSSIVWNNGLIVDAGAVTWLSGTVATTGLVSAANSLVGTKNNDRVGEKIIALQNGNYVVASPLWDRGGVTNAGAATWCSGLGATTGIISSSNSLIGSKSESMVGGLVYELANGNYVIISASWNDGTADRMGAITLGNGNTGITGEVNSTNSLVGTKAYDGTSFVNTLANGNYVVRWTDWDNGTLRDAGAVTWCSGTVPTVGVVSEINSIVGDYVDCELGENFTILKNGNYVIGSQKRNPVTGETINYATWCDGTIGKTGSVNSTNSLQAYLGAGVTSEVNFFRLTNGNYVVINSGYTFSGKKASGAVTWCDGTTGRTGNVSELNSLIGDSMDWVGNGGVAELTNGNYVVLSKSWRKGKGAVTWCNGTSEVNGVVSESNSIIGLNNGDLQLSKITTLPNGNYVILSPNCDNGGLTDVGAVTLGKGDTGSTGVISSSNSFFGNQKNHNLGSNYQEIYVLSNSNFLIPSSIPGTDPYTHHNMLTWMNGSTGTIGVASESNSFIGSKVDGLSGLTLMLLNVYPNGDYSIFERGWDRGSYLDAGAVAYADGETGLSGRMNECNAVLGKVSNGLNSVAQNPVYDYLLVGSSKNNFIRFKTLDKMPVISSVSSASTCGETEADISINSTHGTVKWYTSPSGGSAVYTGNPYHLSNLTTNKTYYAEAVDGTCLLEPRVAVTATVLAGVAKITDGSSCGSGTVDLSAEASSGVINWYDAEIGGNLLATGNLFTTPVLSATTSYWVEAVDGACQTLIRKEVKAYILTNCITELETSSCGITLGNMEDALHCNVIPGATNYRYKVEHAASGYSYVSVRNSIDNLFRLSWLTQNPAKYGTTYDVSVSAYVNGAWTPYGAVCQVTTPPTQLTKLSCGVTLNSIDDNISCYPVALASSYRFHVTNADIAFDQVLEPASGATICSLNTLPGIEVGRTYVITVSALVGAVWQTYGKTCTVSVPFTSKLEAASCNVSLPSISSAIYAEPVANATDYKYEISLNGKIYTVCTRGSNSNLFRLSWMGTKPAEYNTTYSIRVAVKINGVWTAYGTPCNVSTPLGLLEQGSVSAFCLWQGSEMDRDDPELVIFPNPNNGNFVIRSNVQGIFSLCNELGQELFAYQLQNSLEKEVNLTNLSSGVYFLKGNLGDQLIIRKVIVE